MEQENFDSLKGQFILAMPNLADPNFFQTVIMMCEHTTSGSLGIIINRVHPELTCKHIFDEIKVDYVPEAESVPVYLGGPVHNGQIFILHGPPFTWSGCFKVTPSIALSNTIDIIKAVAMGKGPSSFLFVLGCAGWGPKQLESEIMANSWLNIPASENIIFNTPVNERWNQASKVIGINPSLISGAVGHA
ncbi:putative transcriptional regulator [Candidatus Magnetomoraceae bacterium gMMP-1]